MVEPVGRFQKCNNVWAYFFVSAQELREARGQRLIIENGEVKDVSPNVSLATRTPTVTRTGRVIRKPEDPDFEHQIVESQDGNVYEITEETMVTDQDHVDEDVDESSLEQDDTMDMSGNLNSHSIIKFHKTLAVRMNS